MCVRSWECLNSSCAACLCTGTCSSPKPTDNLTWFPAESRAVLRAGCLLCLFCGYGYFFFPPADCQQSVHPGMLWHFKASSRELICQHQLLPSLFLGGKQQAALLPFSAASPAADAAQLAVGAQGGMLTQAGQRQCVWGRGSGVFLVP